MQRRNFHEGSQAHKHTRDPIFVSLSSSKVQQHNDKKSRSSVRDERRLETEREDRMENDCNQHRRVSDRKEEKSPLSFFPQNDEDDGADSTISFASDCLLRFTSSLSVTSANWHFSENTGTQISVLELVKEILRNFREYMKVEQSKIESKTVNQFG